MSRALRGFTPPVQRAPEGTPQTQPLRLHLGCGRTILPGWVNIDCVKLPGVDIQADFDECRTVPLPFAENSVDEMLMAHTIEHINDTLGLMQELHRIAKQDAILTVRVPYGSSDDAFEDQTHVRQYFVQSFGYFSQPYAWKADYGYRGDWQPVKIELVVARDSYAMRNRNVSPVGNVDRGLLLNMLFTERNFVAEMVVTLRAVKPIREPRKELQALPAIEFLLV